MWKSMTNDRVNPWHVPVILVPSVVKNVSVDATAASYNRLSFWEEFWPTTICETGSKHLTAPAN